MVAGALTLVEATDPPYGLIRTAVTAVQADAEPAQHFAGYESPNDVQQRSQLRWVQGFYIQPEHCGGGSLIDPCGNTGGVDPTNPEVIGPHYPLVAEATIDCSTFSSTVAENEARAMRKLRATRSYQLEAEFWTGTAAIAASHTDNQYLAKAGAVGIENNAPVGTTTALAELEQAIAAGTTWGIGFIHATPRTVTYWAENGLVNQTRPGIYQTLLGTFVVAGRGYPGTGPGGSAEHLGPLGGQYSYAYATSQVFVRLGEAFSVFDGDVPGASTAETNLNVSRAAQAVTANWDGCVHASVLVDHNQTRTAIGS